MKGTVAVLLYSLFVSTVLGAWQLIDDFQQWDPGQIFTEATDIGWHAVSNSSGGNSEFWMLEDPFDATNTAMYPYTGLTELGGWDEVWVSKELPDGGISPGDTGTLYFRCLWAGLGSTWHIGTADGPIELDQVTGLQTAPGGWDDFNVEVSLTENGGLVHRDGDQDVPTSPQVILEVNRWYQFWLVIENNWDESTNPPTSTGVYTLYVQGPGIGDWASPTLIPVGTNPPKDNGFFRRAPRDGLWNPQAIRWLMLGTDSKTQLGCPSCGNPFLLDDIYYSPGVALWQEPPEWWWGYYFTNGQRDVDTGDWMGWLNVYTAPIIWSYALEGWILMDQVDESGAWGYFYK